MLVIFQGINPVSVRLTERLTRAGFRVASDDAASEWRTEFGAAGGMLLASDAVVLEDAWVIECLEHSDLRPEALASVSSVRHGSGRPRLELLSPGQAEDAGGDEVIATLIVSVSRNPDAVLSVGLRVGSRGPQLLVHGNRQLFENALPLLTVLADRVLYAGLKHDADTSSADERLDPGAYPA